MYSVIDYFENTVKKYKNKTAVICEDEKITYEELLLDCQKIGCSLKEIVDINTPVIVFMDKGISAIKAFFGALYGGAC